VGLATEASSVALTSSRIAEGRLTLREGERKGARKVVDQLRRRSESERIA